MALTDDKTTEIVTVSIAAGILGCVGFLAHVLASVVQEINWRRLIGGCLFAGFTSSVACMLFLATKMDPLYAAPLSSILGASGEFGFNFLLETYLRKRQQVETNEENKP